MIRKQVGATEFKEKCLKLIDDVARQRYELLITKRGRPVAMLVPMDWQPSDSEQKDTLRPHLQ